MNRYVSFRTVGFVSYSLNGGSLAEKDGRTLTASKILALLATLRKP